MAEGAALFRPTFTAPRGQHLSKIAAGCVWGKCCLFVLDISATRSNMHNAGPNDRWASECSQHTVVNFSLIMLLICRCYRRCSTAVFALIPAAVIGPEI